MYRIEKESVKDLSRHRANEPKVYGHTYIQTHDRPPLNHANHDISPAGHSAKRAKNSANENFLNCLVAPGIDN
jgi:hypothetical protein